MTRGRAKTRVGMVTSNKMDKTVSVEVVRTVRHQKYKKPMQRHSTFKAHDEKNECKVGDKVFIIESCPISRTKRWRVSKILEKATVIEGEIIDEGSEEGGEQ